MKKLFGSSRPKPLHKSPPINSPHNGVLADPSTPREVNSVLPNDDGDSVHSPVLHSVPPQSFDHHHARSHSRQLSQVPKERQRDDRTDLDPRQPLPSHDDTWELINPSNSQEPALNPNPNPYSPPPNQSRSSSLASLPPGASPPAPPPLIAPRSGSPFGASGNGPPTISLPQAAPPPNARRKSQSIRDTLKALDPTHAPRAIQRNHDKNTSLESFHERGPDEWELEKERLRRDRDQRPRRESPQDVRREERRSHPQIVVREPDKPRPLEKSDTEPGERKEDKKWLPFFASVKDRERERELHEHQAEQLTRTIGFLTGTASKDWALVLDVCERASANETSAKAAIKALRREFRYAEPAAQLSAARLWAIMLRNSSEVFISQSRSRKFLDTLEDVISSSRTSPVVRERLLDVLAGATYMSKGRESGRESFRALWRKLKPDDKPDEGIPFDDEDPTFNPTISPTVERDRHSPFGDGNKRFTPTQARIVPPDEDIRRLFEECDIGRGNAQVLSEALVFAEPHHLGEKPIIREFYPKCRASQELISTQIPWATAGAEKSRLRAQAEAALHHGEIKTTKEEQLLAELLKANEILLDVLKEYDNIERVGVERELEKVAEERSKREIRFDRSQLSDSNLQVGPLDPRSVIGSSRSPSPLSQNPSNHRPLPSEPLEALVDHSRNHSHHYPALNNSQAHLLPAPQARVHGPRSLNHSRSRSPSPTRSSPPSHQSRTQSRNSSMEAQLPDQISRMQNMGLEDVNLALMEAAHDEGIVMPSENRPSDKALGKMKVVVATEETEEPVQQEFEDMYFDAPVPTDGSDGQANGDVILPRWKQPTLYVYDAAAERTEQWLKEGKHETVVNGSV